ncbi:MAG: FAD-dependent oxidoreductase [Phormidesmis sp.]
MDVITADILVVGGGTGGTAAAIQAARRGAAVVLVSELPWLGGMLTSAGVCAPDGNELTAFQTGIWGEFVTELQRRHPEGLSHGWVSFFTYNPAVGAQIFADWVSALPMLQWIAGQRPREVLKATGDRSDRITGVRFDQLTVNAKVILDGTELGDLLALADVPYRWGWETQRQWQEPSAPVSLSDPDAALYAITQQDPVQSPTWVVIMQDYGEDAPPIENALPHTRFEGAWAGYGEAEAAGVRCLNYGRLPGDRFMINWPQQGNDYGVGLHRLIESDAASAQYDQEAQQHSRSFACYIQNQLGRRYGLAQNIFPETDRSPGGAFALIPYYRESRRLIGLTTLHEGDILPISGGQVAKLPVNSAGEMNAIALGNYPNDHHYPGFEMPLAPKSIGWGGRQTGTPFAISYDTLVPKTVEGLLVCEKNISVSHIANGATRLQPVVLGIGQAAGMAAALCIEQVCEPRDLAVGSGLRSLQTALLTDPTAPAAVIPLFNLPPEHPHWQAVQQQYLTRPETYPASGYHPLSDGLSRSFFTAIKPFAPPASNQISVKGHFFCKDKNHYELYQNEAEDLPGCILLLTIRAEITELFLNLLSGQAVDVIGTWNAAGNWILCEQICPL